MAKPSKPAMSARSTPTDSPSSRRAAQARAATSAMLVASTATVNTSPLTGGDPAASTASSGPRPFGPCLGPRRGPGQEPAAPSASVICWMAAASAGLTLSPCSRCAAATLLAREITKRR